MGDLLSVDTVFVTVLDYPLSYVEFFGTSLYLVSVWLVAQRNALTWPVGIVSVLLFMALFYQVRVYSAAAQQLYYLGVCAYGWWYWARTSAASGFTFSRLHVAVGCLAAALAAAAGLGLVVTRVHEWAPLWFPEPAAYPFVDALVAVLSVVATWLMARKRVESWIYWIAVDIIAVGLYFATGVMFVSLLHAVLLAIAVRGLVAWTKASKTQGEAP